MLAFEHTYNGTDITAAVEKGVLTVIVTNRNSEGTDDISLNVAGLDLASGIDTTWLKEQPLQEGDEITIKIRMVGIPTIPKNKVYLDKVAMQQSRVQSYYELKAALEKEGLI